jgi:hypothetical protein
MDNKLQENDDAEDITVYVGRRHKAGCNQMRGKKYSNLKVLPWLKTG